jgi:hypothetical protein
MSVTFEFYFVNHICNCSILYCPDLLQTRLCELLHFSAVHEIWAADILSNSKEKWNSFRKWLERYLPCIYKGPVYMRPERNETGIISPYYLWYMFTWARPVTKITLRSQVIPPAGPSRLTSDRHEFRPGWM